MANTLICSKCATLLFSDDQATDPVGSDQITRLLDEIQNRARSKPSIPPDTTPLAIQLKIGPHKRVVELPLHSTIHLGRKNPTLDFDPEVDLSNDGNSARAVSRLHARIVKQDDKVVVEDLGSTNGTFINGIKLYPQHAYPLNDGDVLQLGTLQIWVRIRRQ